MPVKLNSYWTIKQEEFQAYNKFMIKKFIPGINKLGLHTLAGWSVLVGGYSEIVLECAGNDLSLLESVMRDKKYKELKAQLLNYVKNYKTKVLVKTGKQDAYSTDIKENTVKFNQTWDLISDKKHDYGVFTKNEYYPLLDELGIFVAREWEVLIGDGPSIICEGRATDIDSMIRNLQSKQFRQAKQHLKNYIENYQSRILTFHIQKIKGYKSASYNLIDH